MLCLISLFTPIPISCAYESILKKWPNYNIESNLDIMDIIGYARFSLTSYCFIFEKTFYKQINGTAMGCPISGRIAESVMKFLEREIISLLGSNISFWKKYVDDAFISSNILSMSDLYHPIKIARILQIMSPLNTVKICPGKYPIYSNQLLLVSL